MNSKWWLSRCCVFLIAMIVGTSNARPITDVILFTSLKNEYNNELKEPCTALVKEIEGEGDMAVLQCSTPSNKLYTIPYVNTEWIREHQLSGELFSGETELDISRGTIIDPVTLTLTLQDPPRLINLVDIENELARKRRRMQATTGQKTVLVVRIQATDAVTSLSAVQLADDVFGDNGDVNNLRSQYLACSHGKLEFNKAPDRTGVSTSIQNGIVTISPGVATSVGDDLMVDYAITELQNQFSTNAQNLADYIMLCLPPGTMPALGVAYAWMNDFRSVYNDEVCSHISAQMHEIGHNLALAHSSHESVEYGDQSGMMGYSYASDDLPYMCFNAAKSWQLGM